MIQTDGDTTTSDPTTSTEMPDDFSEAESNRIRVEDPNMIRFTTATGTTFIRDVDSEGYPMWYTFATLALLIACGLACVFGDMNFWYNMQPFYDIENLNTYPSVNPKTERGQQLMDAGRVYFADGTGLDMRKAI